MCHIRVSGLVKKVFNEQDINGKSVLEAGSLNVNGSLRSVIEKFIYEVKWFEKYEKNIIERLFYVNLDSKK